MPLARVLSRAAERVQDDGEEGVTLRVFRILPAELRRKVRRAKEAVVVVLVDVAAMRLGLQHGQE